MQRNYGYLETYQGGNPRDYLSDVSDPYVLQYYATELNHAMKRALYCVVSQSSIKSPNIIFPPSRKRKFSGSPGGRKKSFFFPYSLNALIRIHSGHSQQTGFCRKLGFLNFHFFAKFGENLIRRKVFLAHTEYQKTTRHKRRQQKVVTDLFLHYKFIFQTI